MGYFVSIVLFILAILLHKKKRKLWYAPDVLFCYMWAAITFLSSLHLYGMYKSSSYVYFIVLVGSLSFIVGVSLCFSFRISQMSSVSPLSQDFISKRAFWILCCMLFCLRLEPFLKSIALQMAGVDLQTMRNDFFEQSYSARDVLINTVVSVIRPLLEISGVVYFVRDIRRNFFFMLAIITVVMMESTIDGGRFGIAFLIIELVICYSVFSSRPNLSFLNLKRYKGKIRLYVFVLLGAIICITFLRGTAFNDMLKKYYRYFCGDIVFFDQKIEAISNSLPLYPFGTGLWGFWLQFFPLLHALIGLPYPSWYIDATNRVMNTQEFVQIGNDMYTNAFSTPFYYLYADLRLVGVIIGMFAFGLIAGISYRKMMVNTRNKYIIVYILVCQMIFMTIYFYPLTNTGYVLIFMVLLFLCFKKKILAKC